MILAYLSRVKYPLFSAAFYTALLALVSLPAIYSMMLVTYIVGVSTVTSRLLRTLFTRLFGPMPPRVRIGIALLSLSLTLASLVYFSHVYLFFNALPWAFSAPFLTVTAFIFLFESCLLSDSRIENASDYSLVSLILTPRSSFARLSVLLEPNSVRAARELALHHNPIDNAQALANSEQPHSVSISELQARLAEVLERFPADLIIDDTKLYQDHLAALCGGREPTQDEKTEAATRALKQAQEEANSKILPPRSGQPNEALYKKHLDTLHQNRSDLPDSERERMASELALQEEQKAAYIKYRENVIKLSIHGKCPVSLEEIYNKPPNTFSIVEKRYTVNEAVFSVRLEVYENTTFEAVLNNRETALDPIDRDPFLKPHTYPNTKKPGDAGYHEYQGASYPCHYVYYPYEQIQGHGLSLQLCEAMEEFLDPGLAAAKQIALNKKDAPPPAPTRLSSAAPTNPRRNASSAASSHSAEPRRAPSHNARSRAANSWLTSNSIFPASGDSAYIPQQISHNLQLI